jgi:hypothetical protein
MMRLRALIGSAVLALGAGTGCEEMPPVEAPLQPGIAEGAPAPYGEAQPYAPGEASTQGQWVWTDPYGWVWLPADAQPYEVQGEPYVYLYAPTYGWTWFDSPWGWYGPDGGWGWARPWYGRHWGPRYHAYAPPAYRVAPRGFNVAPPAYRAATRVNIAPPSRARNVAPPAHHFAPRTVAMPHVGAHAGARLHGGRR